MPSSPAGANPDIFDENEINENQEPFDSGSLNGNNALLQTSVQIDAIVIEEKRSNARRSRFQEVKIVFFYICSK